MRSLDDVLGGNAAPDEVQHEQVQNAPAEVVDQAPESDQPSGDAPAEAPPAEGAPPAPENDDEDKPLPAHVVKAIRGERNDWKERAIRAEAEAKAIREMQQQQRQQGAPQGDVPQAEVSPQELFEQRLFVERSNMSQLMAKQAYPDLDEKVEHFVEHAKGNPALIAEMRNHPHPFEFAYKKALQLQTLAEIGDDPVAYRERMREQLRAEMAAQPATPPAATAPRAPLPPASLAGARSAAPRNAGEWTGPTPLDQLVKG